MTLLEDILKTKKEFNTLLKNPMNPEFIKKMDMIRDTIKRDLPKVVVLDRLMRSKDAELVDFTDKDRKERLTLALKYIQEPVCQSIMILTPQNITKLANLIETVATLLRQ